MTEIKVPTTRQYHAKPLFLGGLCACTGLGLFVGLLSNIKKINKLTRVKRLAGYGGIGGGAFLLIVGIAVAAVRGRKAEPVRSPEAHKVYLQVKQGLDDAKIDPDYTIPESLESNEYYDMKRSGRAELARLQFLCRPPEDQMGDIDDSAKVKLLGDLWMDFWWQRATYVNESTGKEGFFDQKIIETDPCTPGRGHSWRDHGDDYKFSRLGFLGYLNARERGGRVFYGFNQSKYELNKLLTSGETFDHELLEATLDHFRALAPRRVRKGLSQIAVDLSENGLTKKQKKRIEKVFSKAPVSDAFEMPTFEPAPRRRLPKECAGPTKNPYAPKNRKKTSGGNPPTRVVSD